MLYLAVWQFVLLPLVLPNSDFKFGSNADVELLEAVGEYVDISVFAHATPYLFSHPYLSSS